MKRGGPLKRKKPLLPGSKPLRQGAPISRGAERQHQDKPQKAKSTLRASKPLAAKPKRAARATGEDQLCHGQNCFLNLPSICNHNPETVVPCHSNQLAHGKGKAIKALDIYTVPGCSDCHRELDQGYLYSREEKFSIWNRAYERWKEVRDRITQNRSA